jgi:predicted DNA-binding protein (MmcQ/YjbR family)
MQLDAVRAWCLSKHGAVEDQPFGPDVLVFKVMGKMFALIGLDGPPFSVGLKCDPERALELREDYDGIHPGPYLDKKHWNYVDLASDVPGEQIRELIDHSYALVVAGLRKRDREQLGTPGA